MERESCASFGGGGGCPDPRALGRALYRRALASERLGRRLPSFSLSAAHGKMRGALGRLNERAIARQPRLARRSPATRLPKAQGTEATRWSERLHPTIDRGCVPRSIGPPT